MNSEQRPALGERIRSLRRGARLSQRDLAARAGTSPGWVGQVERGTIASPGADLLEAVAGALGVTVDELLRGRDATERPPAGPGMLPVRTGGVAWYAGYALWGRVDPRAGGADGTGGGTRRVMAEPEEVGGGPEDVFAVLVGDDGLAGIVTDSGRVRTGWRLFVDRRLAAGARPGAVVAAMSATGRLVVGALEQQAGGWAVFDGEHREAVARDDVLGEVVEYHPRPAKVGRVPPEPGA